MGLIQKEKESNIEISEQVNFQTELLLVQEDLKRIIYMLSSNKNRKIIEYAQNI